MRSTHWKCDNCCGRQVVGDARPPGWIILNSGATGFVVCSQRCLAEFGWKWQHGLPMGTTVVLRDETDPQADASADLGEREPAS